MLSITQVRIMLQSLQNYRDYKIQPAMPYVDLNNDENSAQQFYVVWDIRR